jgi:hypothetical protein
MGDKGNLGIRLDLDRVPVRETGMTAFEMMLSESQERMLMVLRPEKEAEARAIFDKWDLDFAVVGATIPEDRFRVYLGEELKADLPLKALSGTAPEYDRPWRETPKPAAAPDLPPLDPAEALVRLLDGERRPMAVGRTDSGQLFLLMLSVGPDAVILANLPPLLKHHAGKVGITAQAVVEFLRGRLPYFSVSVDGERLQASWCIAGNSRSYGGPYAATPGADPFRPGLEVVTLARRGRMAVVPFFFSIPSGRHLRMRGVRRRPAVEVRLEGPAGVPYQLDGDPAGVLPVAARGTDERVWVHLPLPTTRHQA